MDNAEFVVQGFGRCDMDQGYFVYLKRLEFEFYQIFIFLYSRSIVNCWFIAGIYKPVFLTKKYLVMLLLIFLLLKGCVGIMQNKKLFAKVVPQNQSLTNNYAGQILNIFENFL